MAYNALARLKRLNKLLMKKQLESNNTVTPEQIEEVRNLIEAIIHGEGPQITEEEAEEIFATLQKNCNDAVYMALNATAALDWKE